MMYPMPNPSPEVGPNPKCRSDGFPQFDVERTVLLILSQPGSMKRAGVRGMGPRRPRELPKPFVENPSSDEAKLRSGEQMFDPFSIGVEYPFELDPVPF